jgi:5,10-methylenetetrahydromethanopterin reductase
MLALAGQIGDCSVIGTGLTPEVVRDSVKRVAAAASLASRDPSELEVWFTARAALNTSREVAVEQVKGPVASILNHSMRFGLENKDVPEELQGRVQSYVDNYDLADHAGGNNVQLMNELSLTPWALDRWAIVGTPDDWIERLQAIELAGVTRLWFTIGRGLEVQRRSLELLGREVIPFLR